MFDSKPDCEAGHANVLAIGVLFGCCGIKIDGPGLPGGSIIYQGHLFPLKDTYGTGPMPARVLPCSVRANLNICMYCRHNTC